MRALSVRSSVLGWGLPAAFLLVVQARPDVAALLEFSRPAFHAGQGFRLLTGAFVHTNLTHLALNAAALALLVYWLGWIRKPFKAFVSLSALAILVFGFTLVAENWSWARGMSGPLHGLAAYAVATRLKGKGRALALAVLLAKLVLDGAGGATSGLIGAHVLVSHHAVGAAAGLLAGLASQWSRRCHFARIFR